MTESSLPPGQQWVAPGKWPTVGERAPRADDSPWQVEIAGAVRRPLTLALAELQALQQMEQIVDIHCVTRWSRRGVHFGGVPLSVLVDLAQPAPEARYVSFVARSERGHSTSLALDEALRLKTLVVLSIDGAPLDELRGGPVRVVVPGRYFYKSLKWLERIELLSEDRLGFWESTAGYHNLADPALEQRYVASGISKAEARDILANRDIAGRELRGLDARGHDLRGLMARGALLRDADFRGCQLEGANFDGSNLTNGHFQDANLAGATLRGADLEGCDFTGADLRGASLLEARLLAATFHDPARPGSRGAQVDRHTQFSLDALAELMPEQQAYLRAALSAAG